MAGAGISTCKYMYVCRDSYRFCSSGLWLEKICDDILQIVAFSLETGLLLQDIVVSRVYMSLSFSFIRVDG